MGQTAEDSKIWLVKSSGTILGPYALEEVIQNLTNKRISLIDEIRSPDSRWLFIREHKQFANIVQFLRDQQTEAKEDTGVTFVGSRTITMNPEEVTTVPASAQQSAAQAEPESRPITYAAQPQFRVEREGDRRWLIALVWILALTLVCGAGWYAVVLHKDTPKVLGYMDYIKLAQSQQNIGHFDQALNFYRKAESIQKMNLHHRLQMVPLLMVVEKQNVQARQILDEIQQESNLNDKQKLDLENMRAYSYLAEGQLGEARKRLADVVRADPALESAQVNLLELSILEGRFRDALEGVRAIMKAGVKDPLVFLYRSMAAYREYQEPDKLEAIVEDLKRYVGRYQNFQPEAYLLMAAVQKNLLKEPDLNLSIRSLLQLDPDLTHKHMQDLAIHREIFEWNYLSNICELLSQTSVEPQVMLGLSAFCIYQTGDMKTALANIQKARAQFQNDTELLGLHGFLLLKSGRLQEAKALLQASSGRGNELTSSSLGWICQEQKEWECAEQAWKRVQAHNPQSLAAFAGMARVSIAQGEVDRAKDLLQQGMILSSRYRPFLEIKEQLDGL